MQAPMCPRCGTELRAPGLWSSAWQCAEHGAVAPFSVLGHLGPEALEHVTKLSTVPVWRPHGLGPAWVCTGLGYAGDEREGARATVMVMSGPSPLNGAADLLVVAEEPGVGLGARLAGFGELDPGERIASGSPDGHVTIGRHPTALWQVDVEPDRAAFVGEAMGRWLWLVVWPAEAGVVLYDGFELVDNCELAAFDGEIDYGIATNRL